MRQLLQTIRVAKVIGVTCRKLTASRLKATTANAANRASAGLMEANRASAEPMEANRASAVRVTVMVVTVASDVNAPMAKIQAPISLQPKRSMLNQLWKTECLQLTKLIRLLLHLLRQRPLTRRLHKLHGLRLPAARLQRLAALLLHAACLKLQVMPCPWPT